MKVTHVSPASEQTTIPENPAPGDIMIRRVTAMPSEPKRVFMWDGEEWLGLNGPDFSVITVSAGAEGS